MSYLIRCHTLFDITATGARQRSCPVDQNPAVWNLARNQQCNFDTILQSISMRSLPEISSFPRMINETRHKFGKIYKKKVKLWQFDFQVSDINVWKDGTNSLFYLFKDCDDVPMIICGTETSALGRALSTKDDDKNIYFEVLSNEEDN